MAGQRKLTNWNAEVHEDILLAVIKHAKLTAAMWEPIMNELHGKGHEFTRGGLE